MASNPLPLPNELIAMLDRFRQEAFQGSVPALQELTSAYSRLYTSLELRLDVILNRIWNNGGDVVSQAYVSSQLRELTVEIERELTRYQAYLQTVIDNEIEKSLKLGAAQSAELLKRFAGGVDLTLLNLSNPGVLNTMIGLLSWRSTVLDQVEKLAKYYAPLVRDIMVEAIALGYGPGKTAGLIAPFLKKIKDQFKVTMARPYADALRMTRTAQLWAAREATRQNYRASDIVTGWIWFARLDNRVCMSCVSLHGTVHTLDEILNDHWNGRCAMLPIIRGEASQVKSGEEWFSALPPAQQKKLMGPGKYEAWMAGKFSFDQLSVEVEDPTYSTMRVEASLKSLIAEG